MIPVQCKMSTHFFAVCPDNISRVNDLGKCSAFVDYAQPTYGDNCAGVQAFRSSPFQSKVYPVGSWTDQWLALDSSFNTASCTTGVSVADAEPPSISKLADLVAVLCPCTHFDTFICQLIFLQPARTVLSKVRILACVERR